MMMLLKRMAVAAIMSCASESAIAQQISPPAHAGAPMSPHGEPWGELNAAAVDSLPGSGAQDADGR